MLASIIVIAKDGLRGFTIPCLQAIKKNTRGNYQLICVDDGSADGTFHYFQAVADKSHRFGRSQGVAKARNRGMSMSDGDLLCFVDNDVCVTPGWLSGVCKAYNRPGVGIAGAVPSNEARSRLQHRSAGGLLYVPYVSGACFSFSRPVFDRLGYLDTNLHQCGEDQDYCYRAWLAGFHVVSVQDVIVPHHVSATRKHLNQAGISDCQRKFVRKWRGYAGIFPVP